jgi:hypothetical protein
MTRRYLWASLVCFALAVSLATCGATPVAPTPVPESEPQPSPLPNVTLTLAPAMATVTLADASTVLCIAIPEQPSSWAPPGALWTVCQSADKWMAKGVKP